MTSIAIALVVVTVLVLLVRSRGFRIFMGITLGICIGIVAFFFWLLNQDNNNSKKVFPADHIEFVDLMLEPSYGSYYLVGRVRNRSSSQTLNEVNLKLTFQDCPVDKKIQQQHCETIGEEIEYMYVSVPAGQARDIREMVTGTSSLRPKGKLSWFYTIESATTR